MWTCLHWKVKPMSKLLDVLKEAKEKTMEEFLAKVDLFPGRDLSEGNLRLLDARDILYKTINKIAEREFRREF